MWVDGAVFPLFLSHCHSATVRSHYNVPSFHPPPPPLRTNRRRRDLSPLEILRLFMTGQVSGTGSSVQQENDNHKKIIKEMRTKPDWNEREKERESVPVDCLVAEGPVLC